MTTKKRMALDAFLDQMLEATATEFMESAEGKLRAQWEVHLTEMLHNCLTTEGKEALSEVMEELTAFSARETKLYYRQGLSDCVLLLKECKVIA